MKAYHFHLLAGIALTACATASFAQSAPSGDAPQGEAGAGQGADQSGSAEATVASEANQGIIVTGSRIVRAGFQAPTPVTVVSADELSRKAPSNIADALNQLPVFQNSISQNTGDSVQSNRVRSGNYLNLRALGPSRVLVLQDGHRVTPTGNNGGTDTNLIPQMLVDRVDVVTGGASAAYGSDAVSGVVNFVLNKKFEGAKFQIQRGVSGRADNGSYRLGAAFGTSLADGKLHILASAERYHSDGITHRTDRPRGGDFYTYGGAGTAASPFVFYDRVHYSAVSKGGYIVTGPLAGKQFLPDGSLGTFNPGTSIGRSGVAQNGDGGDLGPTYASLVPALTTDQFYGRISYDVNDDIKFYVDGSYNRAVNSDNNLTFVRVGQMTIFRDNAYLNQSALAALGNTQSFTVGREFREFGGLSSRQRSTSLSFSSGIEGKIGGWQWNVGYIHGDSRFNNVTTEPYMPNFYAALDAVRNSSGKIVCNITVTNPGLMDNCVPINTFGDGAVTDAAKQYILRDAVWGTRNRMDVGSIDLSGTLFNTWAGPVSLAVGGEYRHQSLIQTSNNDPAVAFSKVGIRGYFGTTSTLSTNVGSANGSINIKEGYAEITVPLAKDSAIGRSLEINAAGRFTDYSTSGSVKTWKVGATYLPIDGVRIRGTVSRDIRAPSLYELFAGTTVTTQTISDPLTGLFASVPIVSGGNLNLKPEFAKTYTAGIVLQPSFLRGFSASFDYYNIKIKDAIALPFDQQGAVDACSNSGGTAPICSQITRPLGNSNTSPANFPTRLDLVNLNVSQLQTSGVDFEIGYKTDVAGGAASVRLLGTRLFTYRRQEAPGRPTIEYAGSGDFPGSNAALPLPKWRANVEVAYAHGPFSLSVQERMIGGYVKSRIQVFTDNTMPTVFYTDATANVSLPAWSGNADLFLTVNNLFDRVPPLWPVFGSPGNQLPTARSVYDINGRYITIGLRAKF